MNWKKINYKAKHGLWILAYNIDTKECNIVQWTTKVDHEQILKSYGFINWKAHPKQEGFVIFGKPHLYFNPTHWTELPDLPHP